MPEDFVDDPCLRILPEPFPLPAANGAADGTRWQPLRSGLLNLFKYDNEVFPGREHYKFGLS